MFNHENCDCLKVFGAHTGLCLNKSYYSNKELIKENQKLKVRIDFLNQENSRLDKEVHRYAANYTKLKEEIESLHDINLKLNAQLFNKVETVLPDSALFIRVNGGWVPIQNCDFSNKQNSEICHCGNFSERFETHLKENCKSEEPKPKFKSGSTVLYKCDCCINEIPCEWKVLGMHFPIDKDLNEYLIYSPVHGDKTVSELEIELFNTSKPKFKVGDRVFYNGLNKKYFNVPLNLIFEISEILENKIYKCVFESCWGLDTRIQYLHEDYLILITNGENK